MGQNFQILYRGMLLMRKTGKITQENLWEKRETSDLDCLRGWRQKSQLAKILPSWKKIWEVSICILSVKKQGVQILENVGEEDQMQLQQQQSW